MRIFLRDHQGMKLLIIAIAIVGIVMVINGYYRQNMSCPEPKIVYKYIPRTFSEEQDNLPKPSDVFKTMFDGTSILSF